MDPWQKERRNVVRTGHSVSLYISKRCCIFNKIFTCCTVEKFGVYDINIDGNRKGGRRVFVVPVCVGLDSENVTLGVVRDIRSKIK